MKKLDNNELKEIAIDKDMLIGNINRMCVTDSLAELLTMWNYATLRINKIFNMNLNRLMQSDED